MATPTSITLPASQVGEVDEDYLSFTALFEPSENTVCQFGDILLVADDGFHPPLGLRVSSCILAMSSKVFKALFGRKFSEGQTSCGGKGENPRKVKVSDAPRAMTLLCKLLHLQCIDVDDHLSEGDLVDLAVIADKYDCVQALHSASSELLTRLLKGDKIQVVQ